MTELHSPVLQSLVVAIGAGVLIMIFARKMKIPAIALLLVTGFVLGPQVTGLDDPAVFGAGLKLLVTIAVAIILFEGALSLDHKGLREAGPTIRLLLSVGVVVTWLSVSSAVYLLFRFPWRFSLLAGSLVVVTGPTVVGPLLRRLKVTKNIYHILHWESVLIDPIGVFLSILCLGLVEAGDHSTLFMVGETLFRVIIGASAGILVGASLGWVIKKSLVPDEQLNSIVIAAAVVAYGAGSLVVDEAGLLAVVVMGFILGKHVNRSIKKIRVFSEEMAEFLIGTIFIILAGTINVDTIGKFGYRGVALLGVIILVSRPLTVFISTIGSNLAFKEKVFISWLAPRGIVAVSMATLFTVQLRESGNPDAWFLEAFVFSVVLSTVFLYSLSARLVAKRLNVLRQSPNGWLLVGAHELSMRFAEFIIKHVGTEVIIIDANKKDVAFVVQKGFTAFEANALDHMLLDDERFIGIGNVFALTDNEALNGLICQGWSEFVGKEHVFRWGGGREEMSGNCVWQQIPRPGVISADILRAQARICFDVCNATTVSERRYPLASIHNNAVILTGKDTIHNESKGMVLLREITYLHRLTRPSLIKNIQVGDKSVAIRVALQSICCLYPTIPKDATYQELLQREENFPTSIGEGTAIPHTYSEHVNIPLIAVIQAPHGIEWGAFDKKKVTLIFLLISPSGDPERHLSTLSSIAQLASDSEILQQLKRAETAEAFYRAIQSREVALAY